MTASRGSRPRTVPGWLIPHNMEYTQEDTSVAIQYSLPPGSHWTSEPCLNWDLRSPQPAALFGPGTDALSSGVSLVDRPDLFQPHKRRRLSGEPSSADLPVYAQVGTSYASYNTQLVQSMAENWDAASTHVVAPADDELQTITAGGQFPYPNMWSYSDRTCCGLRWPSLPGLYAPLTTQDTDVSESLERYSDAASSRVPLVSQPYVSPEIIQVPGEKCSDLAPNANFPASFALSNSRGPTLGPSELHVGHEIGLLDEQPFVGNPGASLIAPASVETSLKLCEMSAQIPSHITEGQFDYVSQLPLSLRQTNDPRSACAVVAELNASASSTLPGEHHIVFDVVSPTSKSKRGPFKDEKLRQQTAKTRSNAACIECARQRIRCNTQPDSPLGQCLNCVRMQSNRLPRIPCLRLRITEVKLSKTSQVPGYEWTRRRAPAQKDIQNWASTEVKTLHISEGLSNTTMRILVKRFVPQDGDKLERSWVHNGMKRSVPIPPYALISLRDAREAYRHHILATEEGALKSILSLSSPLLRDTYQLAVKLRRGPNLDDESKHLLDTTFELWMVVRFSTMSTWIVGNETLGMSRNILDKSPNPGKIPLPPVLGAQLDNVLIHDFQHTTRHELLKRLDSAFRRYTHANWLVLYLISFILLHNAAMITAHDAKYAQKHGMKRRFAREASVADYHKGATTILAHFHNCTRNHPFSDRCNEEDLKNLAKMTEDQIRFIRDTRVYIKVYERDWNRIRNEGLYEHDFYFISQLYQEPWEPHDFSVEQSRSSSEGSAAKYEPEGNEAGVTEKSEDP